LTGNSQGKEAESQGIMQDKNENASVSDTNLRIRREGGRKPVMRRRGWVRKRLNCLDGLGPGGCGSWRTIQGWVGLLGRGRPGNAQKKRRTD